MTAKGKHQHVEGSWAEKHDAWGKRQVQPNLQATSETEEKDYGISARRRRQSPEPAKEQLPRQSLRRIQNTSLRFKFTHVYIHVLSNSNSKPLPIFNHSNLEVYKCLIREKVVTFRMVKLILLLSIFLITKWVTHFYFYHYMGCQRIPIIPN